MIWAVTPVMIDLQKTFDSVDHEILLHKLGFHDISGSWLKVYQKNRNHKTIINVTFSDPEWSLAEDRRDPFWDHSFVHWGLIWPIL